MELTRDEGVRLLGGDGFDIEVDVGIDLIIWSLKLSWLHHSVDCGDGQNPLIMLTELMSVFSISMIMFWSSEGSTLLLGLTSLSLTCLNSEMSHLCYNISKCYKRLINGRNIFYKFFFKFKIISINLYKRGYIVFCEY